MSSIREKNWSPSILLSPIAVANSVVSVTNTAGLHPKQLVDLFYAGAAAAYDGLINLEGGGTDTLTVVCDTVGAGGDLTITGNGIDDCATLIGAGYTISAGGTAILKNGDSVSITGGADTATEQFEIKRVLSSVDLQVGPPESSINTISNPTLYNGGSLFMPEQERNAMEYQRVLRSVYLEEPAVALRSVLVDQHGVCFDSVTDLSGTRRLAVDAEVSVVIPSVYVQLTDKDDVPNPGDIHDSVRIGDGTDELAINDDGSINVAVTSIVLATATGNMVVDIPNAGATDRVQLPTHACKSVSIQFKAGTGKVFIGGSTVTNASGTNEGVDLDPGDTFGPIEVDNTDAIYVATSNAGNDVKVFWTA